MRQLVLERDETVYAKPDADPGDIFGAYLFAPYRSDTPEPKEPNTAQEEKFESDLRGHYQGRVGNLDKWQPVLQQLVAQGKYKKFLAPPGVTYVYRVMTVNGLQLENLFHPSNEDWDRLDEGKSVVMTGKEYPVRVSTKSHSWTTSLDVFSEIQFDWGRLSTWTGGKSSYLVLMVANLKENQDHFYIQPQGMSNMGIPEQYGYQEEIIGFGGGFPLEKVHVTPLKHPHTNLPDAFVSRTEEEGLDDARVNLPKNTWRPNVEPSADLVRQLPEKIFTVLQYKNGKKVVRKWLDQASASDFQKMLAFSMEQLHTILDLKPYQWWKDRLSSHHSWSYIQGLLGVEEDAEEVSKVRGEGHDLQPFPRLTRLLK